MSQFLAINCRFSNTCLRTIAIAIISGLLLSTPHFCQGSTETTGKVIDKETGQPILGAIVKIESDGQILAETTTDKDGNFQITQDVQGEIVIQVSSTGYHTYTEMLTPDATHTLEISLSSQTFQLAPIEIIGESSRQHRKLTGTMSMLEPEIVDLIKPVGTQELLELIPGINGYADDGFGNSRLSIGIRGLNPRRSARVLILEDGVPIQPALYIYPNAYYNPPADRIDAVEVIKGSAALRYGPQTMGGVVNYTTRKPGRVKGLANQLTVGNNGYYSAFSEWLRGNIASRGMGSTTAGQATISRGNYPLSNYKLPFAYPVLEVGFEEKVASLVAYFETFENLYLTGRSSLFRYLHLHDLFKAGKEVVEQITDD